MSRTERSAKTTRAARTARTTRSTEAERSAANFLPPNPTLPRLRAAAATCRGCDLWRPATQTVFGQGPADAELVMVGEEPGDQEDKQGAPFVGPAGRLLHEAMAAAGIDRGRVYLTNAVKHFKFVRKELTKRRLHKKPTAAEVRACHPWLEEEIGVIKPALTVALGSTAGEALVGRGIKVTQARGRVLRSDWAGPVLITVHPSSVLRAPDESRAEARREFFRDLRRVAKELARHG